MSKLKSHALFCSRRNRCIGYMRYFAAIAFLANATALFAEVQSLQWHEDQTMDGVVTGTLAGHDVRLTSPDGPFNGGINLKHPNQWWGFGTDGVPGLIRAHQEAAAFDWKPGEVGTVDVDLGTSVDDPIFMFAYLDGSMTFDFDDSLSLKLVDQGQNGFSEASVVIDEGNVVRTSGHANHASDGFAVAVKGELSSLKFQTNLDLNEANSVAFSMVDCNPAVGDFNCDGVVGFSDFLALRSNFGQPADFAWEGDADDNGVVNFVDFLLLQSNYESVEARATSVTAVPEPAGVMLAGVAGLMGLLKLGRKQRNRPTA